MSSANRMPEGSPPHNNTMRHTASSSSSASSDRSGLKETRSSGLEHGYPENSFADLAATAPSCTVVPPTPGPKPVEPTNQQTQAAPTSVPKPSTPSAPEANKSSAPTGASEGKSVATEAPSAVRNKLRGAEIKQQRTEDRLTGVCLGLAVTAGISLVLGLTITSAVFPPAILLALVAGLALAGALTGNYAYPRYRSAKSKDGDWDRDTRELKEYLANEKQNRAKAKQDARDAEHAAAKQAVQGAAQQAPAGDAPGVNASAGPAAPSP